MNKSGNIFLRQQDMSFLGIMVVQIYGIHIKKKSDFKQLFRTFFHSIIIYNL